MISYRNRIHYYIHDVHFPKHFHSLQKFSNPIGMSVESASTSFIPQSSQFWIFLPKCAVHHVIQQMELLLFGSSSLSSFVAPWGPLSPLAGDVPGRGRGDPGCDRAEPVQKDPGAALQADLQMRGQPPLPGRSAEPTFTSLHQLTLSLYITSPHRENMEPFFGWDTGGMARNDFIGLRLSSVCNSVVSHTCGYFALHAAVLL